MPFEFKPNIEDIANKLDAKFVNGEFVACCPSHKDTSPSLSFRESKDSAGDQRILFHCFAGCEYREVTDALTDMGVWPRFIKKGEPLAVSALPRVPRVRPPVRKPKKDLLPYAKRLLEESVKGNPRLKEYFEGRGLSKTPYYAEFHVATNCIINPIMDWEGRLMGVQKTQLYIGEDGRLVAENGEIKKSKVIFGSQRGGMVFLNKIEDYLKSPCISVAEGVETALAWEEDTSELTLSVLTASNFVNFTAPLGNRELRLVGDRDLPKPGKDKPESSRFTEFSLKKWVDEGRTVYYHMPLDTKVKSDWLDAHNTSRALAQQSIRHTLPETGMSQEPSGPAW